MPYCDNFWHIDALENISLPACLIVVVKSKTENQLIRFGYCLLSNRQKRKMWNSCCNARPQTSSLQTYGLLTFLTLILWITGYVKYCRNVSSEICQKLNADELKLHLIEAWFGIQQNVPDQPIDQWRVCLNACVKAKGKHFWTCMCCSTIVNNLLWNLTLTVFLFLQSLTSHDFQSFSSVCGTILTRLLNFVLSTMLGQQMWNFYTVLLQIHLGNCLQKIGILDISLIK